MAPASLDYHHHNTWGDDNGPGHVKATFLGPSLQVPFTDGTLIIGQWQQIVFIECDTRPRDRSLVVTVLGR